MPTSAEKIRRMHKQYGIDARYLCKDCCNYYRKIWDRTYSKCKAYGESNSDATDWSGRHMACKMFGKDFESSGLRPLIDVHRNQKEAQPDLPGQERMEI